MANTNPQAILIANTKIRSCADRFGKLYNYTKMLQAEAIAEGWVAMFPVDLQSIEDGAALDGRTVISNTDVSQFIALVSAFIAFMDQTGFANRNLTLKIAVNPEQV